MLEFVYITTEQSTPIKRCMATLRTNREQHDEHSWNGSHSLHVHVHMIIEHVHTSSSSYTHFRRWTLLITKVPLKSEFFYFFCKGFHMWGISSFAKSKNILGMVPVVGACIQWSIHTITGSMCISVEHVHISSRACAHFQLNLCTLQLSMCSPLVQHATF